jgi:hypothetical protein
MGHFRASMGLREIINAKKSAFLGMAILMLMCAVGYFDFTHRTIPKPSGDKAFYTVDDGRTWFIDSIYKTPPFEHDGKHAVRAMVYSYDNGSRTFCPAVERYNPDMKLALDEAVAQAKHQGKPLSSISLFNLPDTLDAMEVKLTGPGHDWVSRNDRDETAKILGSIKAPDGSAVDFVIP